MQDEFEKNGQVSEEQGTPQPTQPEAAPTHTQETVPLTIPEAVPMSVPMAIPEPVQGQPNTGGAFVPPSTPTGGPSKKDGSLARGFGRLLGKAIALFKKLASTKNGRIGLGVAAALLAIFMLFSTHVICFHDWQEATCTTPQTCSICHRTQGDALGHDWQEATCTEAKTCARCGATDGEPLGHEPGTWKVVKEATCTAEGEESTKCARCGAEMTQPIPMAEHEFGEWETTKEASCSEPGERQRKCKNCDEVETEAIDMLEHTPGEWEVIKDVSITSSGNVVPGKRARVCTVCGAELETEEFTIEVTMSQKNALQAAASYLSWAGFSYSRLVEQLEFEGFSHEDAIFAADHCGADWNEQAAVSAESYMSWASFSRERLIEQLMFEGFTREQAEYGAKAVGY